MKKSDRKLLSETLDKALAPPVQRRKPALATHLSEYDDAREAEASAPVSKTADAGTVTQLTPAQRATPAHGTAPAQNEAEPLHRAADAQYATPAQQTTVAGFTRVPNNLLDRILPTLDTYGQSLLMRLYRLSRGFGSDTCRVSVPTLAKACNISERQARKSIAKLEGRELIQRIEQDFGNKNLALRGTTFRVLISDATPARRATPASQTTAAQYATPAQGAANKVNTLKENTQTQGAPDGVSVRVGSRFTLEECRRYAESLRASGINNPGGYATTIKRTGEADELIAAFFAPVESSPTIYISACPDCGGTGFKPATSGAGVTRCKHERLKAENSPA
jgi:DNA-binding Lrp family transcriptional regulator